MLNKKYINKYYFYKNYKLLIFFTNINYLMSEDLIIFEENVKVKIDISVPFNILEFY